MAVDAHAMPVRVIVTDGTTADCTQASQLIEGIEAEALLADRAYDTNEIVAKCEDAGIEAVIPPKKNRTVQREYDKDLYKLRHLVENAMLHLKDGVVLPRAMQKMRLLFWPSHTYDVSLFGLKSIDDTIYDPTGKKMYVLGRRRQGEKLCPVFLIALS